AALSRRPAHCRYCRGPAADRAASGRRPRRHRGHRRYSAQARSADRSRAAGADVMAQLTDDCFAFSGPLMPIDEVERLIGERVAPVQETEEVTLANARGRVVARDVIAPVDLPPFDNSAVDGYAVRHGDLDPRGETKLAIVDRVTAGHASERPLAK